MKRNARAALVAVLAGAVVLALVAFAAGAAVVGSESTVESTVVTTQVGNVTAPGGGLAVAVRGDGRFADRVADRLATRLTDDGYETTSA